MMKETAGYFENMAKKMGLSIKIPRPNRAAKNVCSAANGLSGILLIGTGAILKKPSLIVLGALGIASAVLISLDLENFDLPE